MKHVDAMRDQLEMQAEAQAAKTRMDYANWRSLRSELEGLRLTESCGAIIVHTKKNLRGEEIDAFITGDKRYINHRAMVVEHSSSDSNKPSFTATFPELSPGKYIVSWGKRNALGHRSGKTTSVSVFAGHVAEIDWR